MDAKHDIRFEIAPSKLEFFEACVRTLSSLYTKQSERAHVNATRHLRKSVCLDNLFSIRQNSLMIFCFARPLLAASFLARLLRCQHAILTTGICYTDEKCLASTGTWRYFGSRHEILSEKLHTTPHLCDHACRRRSRPSAGGGVHSTQPCLFKLSLASGLCH